MKAMAKEGMDKYIYFISSIIYFYVIFYPRLETAADIIDEEVGSLAGSRRPRISALKGLLLKCYSIGH